MKIAFVGKGGSGKTTLATQAVLHLLEQGATVLALDADINIHFARALEVPIDSSRALSQEPNMRKIRTILRGDNHRIVGVESFVKTTPPGRGSHLIHINAADPVIAQWAVPFHARGFAMHVGTYEKEEIGTSCYHSNLAIAENVLSHLVSDAAHWLVADMVAGTDAFSGSLHLQFDAIVLVVEPTPEGVAVFEQYRELATAAGVWDRVVVVANKVECAEDEEYLRAHVGNALVVCFPTDRTVRRASQQGERATVRFVEQLTVVLERVRVQAQHPDARLPLLYALHRKHAAEDYIVARCGSVVEQIDPAFSFDRP